MVDLQVWHHGKQHFQCFWSCFTYILMPHNVFVLYFRLPYFHVSSTCSVLFLHSTLVLSFNIYVIVTLSLLMEGSKRNRAREWMYAIGQMYTEYISKQIFVYDTDCHTGCYFFANVLTCIPKQVISQHLNGRIKLYYLDKMMAYLSGRKKWPIAGQQHRHHIYIYIYIYIYICYSCENDIVHHKRWNEIASQNIFKTKFSGIIIHPPLWQDAIDSVSVSCNDHALWTHGKPIFLPR